jgi:hypothetical protein
MVGTDEPVFGPTNVHELLDQVATASRGASPDNPSIFLAACYWAAVCNDGYVSVNDVRTICARIGADIPPRQYSAMWSRYTGVGRPMITVPGWEMCAGSASGNDGRPYRLRLWVGAGLPRSMEAALAA